MHRLLLIFWLITTGSAATAAETMEHLYQAKTITTGTRAEYRPAAFAICLRDVLVKSSGNPALSTDPRLEAVVGHAADYVKSFSYRDRLEGRPIHDEQGTRDRPHVLTANFDERAINDILRTLGSKPWHAERPAVQLVVRMNFGAKVYMVASNAKETQAPREAIEAASYKLGVPFSLPDQSISARLDLQAPLTQSAIQQLHLNTDQPILLGDLKFVPSALGWVAKWQLIAKPRQYRWKVEGVNFDEAFRVAFRGVAQIFSDNGTP